MVARLRSADEHAGELDRRDVADGAVEPASVMLSSRWPVS